MGASVSTGVGCRCGTQVWSAGVGAHMSTGVGYRCRVQVKHAGVGSGAGLTRHAAFQETGEAQRAELVAAKTD